MGITTKKTFKSLAEAMIDVKKDQFSAWKRKADEDKAWAAHRASVR